MLTILEVIVPPPPPPPLAEDAKPPVVEVFWRRAMTGVCERSKVNSMVLPGSSFLKYMSGSAKVALLLASRSGH